MDESDLGNFRDTRDQVHLGDLKDIESSSISDKAETVFGVRGNVGTTPKKVSS